jgi:hypothetical protein
MATLFPATPDNLIDAGGRPYFLWDVNMTIDEFRARLAIPDESLRAYFIAKLMRQAKPDDVFSFVTPAEILGAWALVEHQLGRSCAIWTWLFAIWEKQGHVRR